MEKEPAFCYSYVMVKDRDPQLDNSYLVGAETDPRPFVHVKYRVYNPSEEYSFVVFSHS